MPIFLQQRDWVFFLHLRSGHKNVKNYKAIVGEFDTSVDEGREQVFGVDFLKRHPNFVHEGYINDIMLLKAKKHFICSATLSFA